MAGCVLARWAHCALCGTFFACEVTHWTIFTQCVDLATCRKAILTRITSVTMRVGSRVLIFAIWTVHARSLAKPLIVHAVRTRLTDTYGLRVRDKARAIDNL